MAWFNEQIHLIWSPAGANQIETMTGTLADAGISFGPFALFTNMAHERLSDVIAHDGALYIAAETGDTIRLLSTSIGGNAWQEVASCETTYAIRARLLFADAAGDIWVAQGISNFGTRLQKLVDCSTRDFPVAATNGNMIYHPGD
jgi:hypothetical protein